MKQALVLVLAAGTLWAADLHVSPAGNDGNPGTREAPFRTLNRARDAARREKARGAVTVWLHGGTYWLPAPFVLGPEDAGTAEAPATYRALPGEDVWLNGGLPLAAADFGPVEGEARSRLPEEARGHVRQLRLAPEQAALLSPAWPDTWWIPRHLAANSELFADGQRLPLARWPNGDEYTTFGDIVEPAYEAGQTPEFRYEGDRPERWNAAEAPFLFGYWRRGYRAEFIRIQAIDRDSKTIRLAARNSLGPLEDGGARHFFAVNLLEELDTPGEWYLDRGRGLLYLWPPPHFERLVLSVNPTAVIEGNGVEHVHFRDLGIECSARDGIRLTRSHHCRIVACEVRNVAFDGIVVSGNHNLIAGCDIHHTGNRALTVETGDRFALEPGGTVVENCHIHHTNRIVRAGDQAVHLAGVGGRIAHNLIHDCGYIAIRFSGNEHLMEYNRLFRTNTETAEGGVFYTGRDWTSRGSVIRYNFIHHVEDTREGFGSATRFVHLDDSAPEIHIHGNVCYRLGGGVSICGGAANQVHDNLFVECHWGVDIGPRGHDMFRSDGQGGYIYNDTKGWTSLPRLLERYKWNEPPLSTRYPKLGEIFTKDPIAAPWFNLVARNAMVDCGRGIREMGMEPGWSTVEDNWDIEDPGFVEPDRTQLDFRLRPGGPLMEKGFQPIPFADIGPYASADRRSWPLRYEPVPVDWQPRWMHLRDAARQVTDGLPIFKVMPVTGDIRVDGIVDPMEWTPGDATGANPEIHDTAEIEYAIGQKRTATHPSQAMLQTDRDHLYVNFRNPVNPVSGVSGGQLWGRDDAVEIALAELDGDRLGPIVLLRGYADGHWESSNEAGAPAEVVARASRGVRYAADIKDRTFWSAEWAIPFAALGIEPAIHNPRLAFNLSVRKQGDDEWLSWSRTDGYTHNVREGGLLWLAQFGEMAPGGGVFPAVGRIDLDSRRHPVLMAAGPGCTVSEWAKPVGCYLTASTGELTSPGWHEMLFEFTPREDGVVTLKLMGNGVRTADGAGFVPVWTYYDSLQVEGAELVNGNFAPPGERNLPHGWRRELNEPLWIHDPAFAASGEHCVKTWHNGRLAQDLELTKGQTVRIRLKVRGR